MPDNKQCFIRVSGQRIPVDEDTFLEYHRSKRRDRYFEHDIKAETLIHDEDGNVTGLAPSKEDSLERLRSLGGDFDDGESVEDTVVQLLMLDKLHTVLNLLLAEERTLINALFFSNGGMGMTERKYTELSGIPQKTINDRKQRILAKLRKLIES